MSLISTRLPFLTLLISFICLSCSNDKTASLSTKSIIYCSEGSPDGFNPQTVSASTTIDATSNQLYNRLLTFNKYNNELLPSLAKSWHVTKDGTKFTFYLRKDVEFHHTGYFTPSRKLNADDVLFSFTRVLDRTHEYHQISGGSYPFFERIKLNNLVDNIEKINDYTVRFTLRQPSSSFLANLTTDFAVIHSQEYAQYLSDRNSKQQIDLLPIGTGPFKFKEYRVGAFIRYLSHEKYWQKKIALEQLIFDITPSNTGRLTKLLAKECDVVSYPIAHKKIIERTDLQLDEINSFNIAYLGFNTSKPPFNNRLVRKAVSYAINKAAIIDAVYFGKADIANTIIPPSSWAYDKETIKQPYSITEAKKILIKAGYSKGFSIDLWALAIENAYNPDAITTAKLIAEDLKAIGIHVNIIEHSDEKQFYNFIKNGNHDAVLNGWTAEHPDPDNFFTPLLKCNNTSNRITGTFWCNDKVDLLIHKTLVLNDKEVRKTHYSNILRKVETELPLVPLAHSKRFQARSKNITGTLLKPFGGINFQEAKKN